MVPIASAIIAALKLGVDAINLLILLTECLFAGIVAVKVVLTKWGWTIEEGGDDGLAPA
jgi:hypothetical protein